MSYDHEHTEPASLPQEIVYYQLPMEAHDGFGRMCTYLTDRDLKYDLAQDNGWYVSTDTGDHRLRLVIPAIGRLVRGYWQARAMSSTIMPKYLSAKGPRGDAIVCVSPWPNPPRKSVVLVEGPMCALAAAGIGFCSIALMGASPPQVALALAVDLMRGRPCVVLADSDRPDMWAKLLAYLSLRGIESTLMVPTATKDLADMVEMQRGEFLKYVP